MTKLDVASTIYNPETTSALIRYGQHLRATRERLEERRELAFEELQTDKGLSGPLAEITQRYAELVREMEDVTLEIIRQEQEQ